MKKEKLLEMAREAGVTDGIELDHEIEAVVQFANEILELAAQECEDQSNAWHGQYAKDYAEAIRNLK